jgi:hypothetical protein
MLQDAVGTEPAAAASGTIVWVLLQCSARALWCRCGGVSALSVTDQMCSRRDCEMVCVWLRSAPSASTSGGPPAAHVQRIIVAKLRHQYAQRGLVVGDAYYIVDAKWYRKWCDAVAYSAEVEAGVAIMVLWASVVPLLDRSSLCSPVPTSAPPPAPLTFLSSARAALLCFHVPEHNVVVQMQKAQESGVAVAEPVIPEATGVSVSVCLCRCVRTWVPVPVPLVDVYPFAECPRPILLLT